MGQDANRMLSEHQLQPLHIEHGLTELRDDHGATWCAFLAQQVWSQKLAMFLAQTPDQLLPPPFPKEARAQLPWEANTWPCCPRDGRALIRAKKGQAFRGWAWDFL
ncbi:protein FAM89A [Platysternon megacephalum]|uniref:Protein FAM89A n=1 Tax=Platysternon megacephalum TaxID=55544 RepID=A0A4D9EGU0_9SAUR|nr:protein FAM89A [Platysternon megacephalum]